ncbi:MAG: sigma-70 family RNA polymerase sigma factor [Phycisphaera sp.]|nr:sigma-70 family RNA polymerase sigma factor [Phycisphaera sp.]
MSKQDRQDNFVRVLTDRQPALYGYIFSLLPNRDAAWDVLQETNLSLWKKCDGEEEIHNLDALAHEVARYEVMTWLTKNRRDKLRFSDEVVRLMAEDAAARPARADKRAALRECLRDLPEHTRELVQRRYAPGGSVQTLADALGRSTAAVSQALYRVRNALKRCIEHRLTREGAA